MTEDRRGLAEPTSLPWAASGTPAAGAARFPARGRATWRVLSLVGVAAVMAGSCAAPARGEFNFVAPGGQATIFYDPPQARGRAPVVAGDSVMEPGHTVGTADYPGRVVVLNVWGSWCGPCRAETPRLQRVLEQTRGLAVTFLGVDVRDDRAAAGDFLRDRGVSYPSIFDPPGRSLLALRGYPRNVVPSTIVLDRAHRVAAVFLTAITEPEFEPLVRRLAAEPAPPAVSVATATPGRPPSRVPAAGPAPAGSVPAPAPGGGSS